MDIEALVDAVPFGLSPFKLLPWPVLPAATEELGNLNGKRFVKRADG